MGRSRYQVIDRRPHFITSTTMSWLMLFHQPDLADAIFSSLRFLQAQQRLTLHAYVLMENHLHLIVSADDLSHTMQSFKSFTAKAIVQALQEKHYRSLLHQLHAHKQLGKLESTYQVWQEGFHPQVISSSAMLQQKLEYIHHNPVKRGYIDDPCHWRYSSARNYAGQPGILEVELLSI
jgi:putative transposase